MGVASATFPSKVCCTIAGSHEKASPGRSLRLIRCANVHQCSPKSHDIHWHPMCSKVSWNDPALEGVSPNNVDPCDLGRPHWSRSCHAWHVSPCSQLGMSELFLHNDSFIFTKHSHFRSFQNVPTLLMPILQPCLASCSVSAVPLLALLIACVPKLVGRQCCLDCSSRTVSLIGPSLGKFHEFLKEFVAFTPHLVQDDLFLLLIG